MKSPTRTCTKCQVTKPLEAFGVHRQSPDGRRSRCRPCRKVDDATYNARPEVKERTRGYWRKYAELNAEQVKAKLSAWHARNKTRRNADARSNYKAGMLAQPERYILYRVRESAKRRGIEFNLDITDIIIPEVCPVLGIKLASRNDGRKGPQQSSPSLDRKDPAKGYIKGNVQVISHRANTLKNNATLEELELVLAHMKRLRVG